MPIFEVANYTHYNTDDILKLFDLVESAVQENKGDIQPSFARRWMVKGERLGLRVTIKDYNPTNIVRFNTRWTSTGSVREEVPQAVKYAPTPSTDLRIVTPDRLWASPLEALAAMKDGNNLVPPGVVVHLVNRIGELYDVSRHTRNNTDYKNPDCSGYEVRFERQVANRIDKDEKVRSARKQAISALDEALHHKTKVDEYAEHIKNDIERALKHFRRSKIPLTEREEVLVEKLNALLAAAGDLERVLRAAKAER